MIAIIAGPNRDPQIISTPRIQTRLGDRYFYQVKASDPDGDLLTFELTTAPAGMTLDTEGLISWIPEVIGSNTVTVEVQDPTGATATQTTLHNHVTIS